MNRLATIGCLTLVLLLISGVLTQAGQRAGAGRARERGPMMERMKEIGMDENMMARCRQLMRTEISRFNPSALMAMQEDLELTQEQMNKLKDIVKDAREKARAVLKEEQIKEVDKLPMTPTSSMAMHQKMGTMMREKGAGQMRCPMMDITDTAATRPAERSERR